MYYVIHCDEDGDVDVIRYNREELLKALKEEYYGPIEFFDELDESNPQYWGNKILIVRGEIVKPKPVQVVKEYKIE